MINRLFLKCPGCNIPFIARIGVSTAKNTRFYLPCPNCSLPIKGSMDGEDIMDYRFNIECEKVHEHNLPEKPKAVTIDPFVPSKYNADSFDKLGYFPTMTLVKLLGSEKMITFEKEHSYGQHISKIIWPEANKIFNYYLMQNWPMFENSARVGLDIDSIGSKMHERTSIAYSCIYVTTHHLIGRSNIGVSYMTERFLRKHKATLKNYQYISLIRNEVSNVLSLEKNLFNTIDNFIREYEVWCMGRLNHHITEKAKSNLNELTLFRDEFSTVRDLYQQGFEIACKCLWILISAQNSLKYGDPNEFGDKHPNNVPQGRRATSINKFNKLPNAHKISYVSMVPGWEVISTVLDNKRRNTIGHATVHHDLKDGRIYSDTDTQGTTYIQFLGEIFDMFTLLSEFMQIVRCARIITSPDFHI